MEKDSLLGDKNIVCPVRELIDGGYNLDEIKYIFGQLIKQDLLKEVLGNDN